MKNFSLVLIILILVSCRLANDESGNGSLSNNTSLLKVDSGLVATSADLYYNIKQYDSALTQYEELLLMDSTNGRYQYRAGICKARLKRPSEAIKHFVTSARLNYRVKDSYETLGFTYYILLQNDSLALYYFRKAQSVQFDPEIQKFVDKLSRISHGRVSS